MSSGFCSLDEAFPGPVVKNKSSKKSSRSSSTKESFVPGPLPGSPEADAVPEPMGPPLTSMGLAPKPDANGAALQEFFPLPGETAEPDEWAKAFTLEGSQMPPMMRKPAAPPADKWRAAAAAAAYPMIGVSAAPIPSDIQQRLDTLTKQLESLTSVTPMQSTAELFLFIAIGLLFLLAMDTLLRCATSVAISKNSGSLQRGGSSSSGYRSGLSRRFRLW